MDHPEKCTKKRSPSEFGMRQADLFDQIGGDGHVHILKMLESFECVCKDCEVELHSGYFRRKDEIEAELYYRRQMINESQKS